MTENGNTTHIGSAEKINRSNKRLMSSTTSSDESTNHKSKTSRTDFDVSDTNSDANSSHDDGTNDKPTLNAAKNKIKMKQPISRLTRLSKIPVLRQSTFQTVAEVYLPNNVITRNRINSDKEITQCAIENTSGNTLIGQRRSSRRILSDSSISTMAPNQSGSQ